MKTLILTITATGVVAGLCFYAKPRTTKALSTDTVIPFEEQTTGNLTAKVPKGLIPANTRGAPTQTSHSISKQVWQRGAAFFHDNAELQKKLAAQLSEIVENRLQSLSHFDIVHL